MYFNSYFDLPGIKDWTTITPKILEPVNGQTTWLDREYLIVIVALASLSIVLLLGFFVICFVRIYFGTKKLKGK